MTSVEGCRSLSGMKTKIVSVGIRAEEFIKIWQTAKSLDVVVKITGQNKHNLTVKAATFRARGIPLKHFRTFLSFNKESLIKIALKYAPK